MNDPTWLYDLILPLIMIVFDYLFSKKQPKNINYFIGYRTKRSMASKENWIYANKRLGELWFKLGWLVFILVLLVRLFIPVENETLTLINMCLSLPL
ncbi:SdpI/YhfL protein family protein [Halolactibacillus halophilus]|uniref:SdpI/YhfL protein family protein n=1 Tax=Halolactibacillus halophilus TaxID=306540 RepID=A0A1I5T5I1_9BACI|nr:SdpI family protein [Halolactibacillus halophilus]SFP78255.1 SdpI/YhfL protein family protein [Halolactibacillus halophilus]